MQISAITCFAFAFQSKLFVSTISIRFPELDMVLANSVTVTILTQ